MYNTRKYAWIPVIVKTWRPRGTKAIIWLQSYYKNSMGTSYCLRLGLFSYEFY